jgi:hypothetical protein
MIDIPYTKVFIHKTRLTGLQEHNGQTTEAYLFSAYAFLNRPLFFTAHTVDGAIFSGLTVDDFVLDKTVGPGYALDGLQPWGCLGERIVCVQHSYLKDYQLTTLKPFKESGRYLMTFMFMPQGHFEEDPEQMKTMTMIALDCGQICLMPNNYFLAKDDHFTNDNEEWKLYRRSSIYKYGVG